MSLAEKNWLTIAELAQVLGWTLRRAKTSIHIFDQIAAQHSLPPLDKTNPCRGYLVHRSLAIQIALQEGAPKKGTRRGA